MPVVRRNVTARGLWRVRCELVRNVVKAYTNIRNLSVIVSSAPDHNERSPRWTPTLAHYKIDTENLVHKTFATRSDRDTMMDAWTRLVENGFDTIDDAQQRCIIALAATFDRAGLHPKSYFKVSRFYNAKPQRSAA